MIKPANDFILLELYEEYSGIIRPDVTEYGRGDTFIVKAVGPGYYTDSGQIIAPDVKEGDRIWLGGQILKLPYGKETILLARAGDILAFERKDEVGEYKEQSALSTN